VDDFIVLFFGEREGQERIPNKVWFFKNIRTNCKLPVKKTSASCDAEIAKLGIYPS
jgi:hypothetical protein